MCGAFDLRYDLDKLRQKAKSGATVDQLYTQLGFLRARAIIRQNSSALLSSLLVENVDLKTTYLNKTAYNEKEIYYFCKEDGEEADFKKFLKTVLLTSFPVPYKEAINLVEEITKNGGPLGHEYSLAEALFIVHMRPTGFGLLHKWSASQKMMYAKSLMASLAKMLEVEGKLPKDFKLSVDACVSEEENVRSNIIKLVEAYVDEELKKAPESKKQPDVSDVTGKAKYD